PGVLGVVVCDVDNRPAARRGTPPTPPGTPPAPPAPLPMANVTLVRTPYLTATARDTVSILWTTQTATDTVIEYGSATSTQKTGNPAASETAHTVTITGLTAGTVYNYRVVTTSGGGGQVGAASTFTTAAPATAASVTFV